MGLRFVRAVHTAGMKRMLLICLAALALLVLLSGKLAPRPAAAEVLAAKLRVRDALLPLFEAAGTYEDARAFVLDHGAALLSVCQTTLAAAGIPYGAQLLLGVSDFPDRTYNGTLFPAGPYDALQIVLGDGAGHNWWCVLFPPLCIVTRDGSASLDGAAQDASTPVTFESDILAFLRDLFGWS